VVNFNGITIIWKEQASGWYG